MRFVFSIVLMSTMPTGIPARAACTLTEADKVANAALSFEDFDQRDTSPSTARTLSDRGCMNEAVAAAEDYLINGPPRTDYQQRVILWHMAQHLALAGDERRAAHLAAATRVPAGNNDNLDWNSYVKATRAFLIKDRKAFDAAASDLGASVKDPDRINSGIVRALGRCWMKPYRIAYDPDCGK